MCPGCTPVLVCSRPSAPAWQWPWLPRPAPPCRGLCGRHLDGPGLWLPAPGPVPALSGLAGTAQGTEPPASHVPHGSIAVPCPYRRQLVGACPSEEPTAPPAARGAAPQVPPSAGGSEPRPQPQPLPSLVAPLAPARKSGADVEAAPGACLRLGAGSIRVAPFLPHRSREEPWMPHGGQGCRANLLLAQPPGGHHGVQPSAWCGP